MASVWVSLDSLFVRQLIMVPIMYACSVWLSVRFHLDTSSPVVSLCTLGIRCRGVLTCIYCFAQIMMSVLAHQHVVSMHRARTYLAPTGVSAIMDTWVMESHVKVNDCLLTPTPK